MVPAACAMRSLLALKLFGNARHSHVMSSVLDEGLALFAGLNVIPKRSFLTEYSCRIAPACYPKLMRHWFDTVSRLGLRWGTSFDLDFHTIPFHGDDAAGREALRLQAEPAAEGDAGVPGPGRRDPRLLLCQRRAAQGPAERRDPPLRRVLEAADRPPSRGTHLRLQADDLRQAQRS